MSEAASGLTLSPSNVARGRGSGLRWRGGVKRREKSERLVNLRLLEDGLLAKALMF